MSIRSPRDVPLIYVYRILSRLYFHPPILFVFFYGRGLDIFRLELLLWLSARPGMAVGGGRRDSVSTG